MHKEDMTAGTATMAADMDMDTTAGSVKDANQEESTAVDGMTIVTVQEEG
jgi:hypothetical protein